MIRRIECPRVLTDKQARKLKGKPLPPDYPLKIYGGADGAPVDLVREDGTPLLLYRPKATNPATWDKAMAALRRAATKSNTRGGVVSGTIGCYEPRPQSPADYRTAFTRDDPDGWRDLQPLLQEMSDVYRRELPDRYAVQARFWRATSPECRILEPFTTGTVNKCVEFDVHRDRNNLRSGIAVMAVRHKGHWEGGLFALPQYQVAVDLRDGDVILCDNSEYHGNTPFVVKGGRVHRQSVVLYYRRELLRHASNDPAALAEPGAARR